MAINDADNGDQIEVGPETYNEAIIFNGKAVRLYSSGGPDVTIIDGTGNYHVVQCVSGEDANTVLEGFTITGGNANGTDPNDKRGGGMFNFNSSPTVTNCIFSDNWGYYGGGMVNVDGSNPEVTNCAFSDNAASSPTWGGAGMCNLVNCSPRVINCTFTDNTATYDGGGISNYDNSSPTVTNCTFTGNSAAEGGAIHNSSSNPTVADCTFSSNSAGYRGGGMYNSQSSPTVTDCTFSYNSADNGGGGMYNYNNSSPAVTNCTFIGNSSDYGAGMWNYGSNPKVINCTFSANTGVHVGGMYNESGSNPAVTNCTFSDNTASSYGGGMSNYRSAPNVTNCTFSYNSANNGGGVSNGQSSPTVTKCTFSYNSANNGGGMYNYQSSPTVTNCILWGNTAVAGGNEIALVQGSTVDVNYCDVKGGQADIYKDGSSTLTWGINIDADPLFVDPYNPDPNSWNLRLASGSPCIDAGDNNSLPADTADLDGDGNTAEPIPFDLDGGTRVVDGDGDGSAVVDMGAFELQRVHNITQDTWYKTIQAAIDDANNYDQIEVAPGSYPEAINFNGKAVRLYSSGGPDVTTIDGTGHYHVVQCVSGEDANTILEGFTITGGNANSSSWPDYHGGGMYNDNSSPTVTNCTFSGNSASSWGGGMYNWSTSPTVTDCTFSGNSADSGGGIGNNNSSPTVTNCTFSGNSTSGNGGGMFNYNNSNSIVTNCNFSGNSADQRGGGMFNLQNSSPAVTNCTFSGNSAGVGGGMYNTVNSSPTVTNCIFWGDAPDEIYGDSPTVSYSDIQGSYTGTGNINADPCFIDPNGPDGQIGTTDDNLRLKPDSPCIDAGNNSVVTEATDLDGNPRITDGDDDGTAIVDMGAFELQLRVHNITQDTRYITIQAAIDHANEYDQIEVAPGTYNEAINFNGKAVRLYSSYGPQVTTIDGTGHYHVVQCVNSEDANTILEGFTITGGNADGPEPNDTYGGGMFNYWYSSPTVTNCTFSGNTAYNGGGMCNYFYNSNPTVTNCTFSGNSAERRGGGMYSVSSHPKVTNCTFSGNTAYDGGGMSNSYAYNATVTDCTFSGNSAANGGGMSNVGSSPTVTNCTFSGNSTQYGGGIYNYNSSPTVTNCTFSGNSAGTTGGGMYNYTGSDSTVTNCIIWGDTPDEIFNNAASANVTYSDIQGGYTGAGNINADPCFVTGPLGDYYLSQVAAGQAANSPCVDAGGDTAANLGMDESTTRTDQVEDAGTVDMGYHYRRPEPWDFYGDWKVNFIDFAVLAGQWLQAPGVPSADIAPPGGDGIVDELDLALLAENWLADL